MKKQNVSSQCGRKSTRKERPQVLASVKGAGRGIDSYPVIIYLFSGREKTENEDGLVREKGGITGKIAIFPFSVLSIPMRLQIRPPPI